MGDPFEEASSQTSSSSQLVEAALKCNDLLNESNALKEEAAVFFRQSRWDEALEYYRLALLKLPPRQKNTETGVLLEPGEKVSEGVEPEDYVKARAILNGNMGACYLRMNNVAEAVERCTESLLDDPHYIKVLRRRVDCNERIGTWSSLTQAQSDLNLISELSPSNSILKSEISQRLKALEGRISAAQNSETREMVAKLKELGNSVLGNFGLSTDNFKLEPNGQGGYSMQFKQ